MTDSSNTTVMSGDLNRTCFGAFFALVAARSPTWNSPEYLSHKIIFCVFSFHFPTVIVKNILLLVNVETEYLLETVL